MICLCRKMKCDIVRSFSPFILYTITDFLLNEHVQSVPNPWPKYNYTFSKKKEA